jgi:hypothetical protein
MSASWKAENLQRMGKGKEGRETASGNQVVSTRMTNVGECIVFGIEVNDAATRTITGLEGSINAVSVAGNREALGLEKVTDGIMCFVFSVGDFGIRPYL